MQVGHDYLAKLLYEVFVSNYEGTTLGSLATLLNQPARDNLSRARCLLPP